MFVQLMRLFALLFEKKDIGKIEKQYIAVNSREFYNYYGFFFFLTIFQYLHFNVVIFKTHGVMAKNSEAACDLVFFR